MKNLFLDSRALDSAAREKYSLTEEIMMENAAMDLGQAVYKALELTPGGAVAVLCGSGNNGADGYAFARRSMGRLRVTCIAVSAPKSELCKGQASRAAAAGVPVVPFDPEMTCGSASYVSPQVYDILSGAKVIVDCVYGSGFHGSLSDPVADLMDTVNSLRCKKIACDVPTGLDKDGHCDKFTFRASATVSMGALKLALYSDSAKDYVGRILCGDLGVTRQLYESSSDEIRPVAKLLEQRDMNLPRRLKENVNKGSFGHAAIASGEKVGASCIAGTAALRFGAGLVTLVRCGKAFPREELPKVPADLMTSSSIPAKTTAVAFGMGLGRSYEAAEPWLDWLTENPDVPCVVDADMFYVPELVPFISAGKDGVVLTPHPKELSSLLSICGLGEYSVEECIEHRAELVTEFCRKFPGIVLVAKGANPVIGCCNEGVVNLFVNPLGRPALAKAGSGDVLSGVICSLLAQGFRPLDAAVSGSLAHALASRKIRPDYSLTPFSLIGGLSKI